jgi:hypothetical protein
LPAPSGSPLCRVNGHRGESRTGFSAATPVVGALVDG